MSGVKTSHQQHELGAYDGDKFFRGVDSELALRKRYKELLKIFHPDNKCGDTKRCCVYKQNMKVLEVSTTKVR